MAPSFGLSEGTRAVGHAMRAAADRSKTGRHLLCFGREFLCSNRSHVATIIAQKFPTKTEEMAPRFGLSEGTRAVGHAMRAAADRSKTGRHLLCFGREFLCSNRSHVATIIAQKFPTKTEEVAPRFGLSHAALQSPHTLRRG